MGTWRKSKGRIGWWYGTMMTLLSRHVIVLTLMTVVCSGCLKRTRPDLVYPGVTRETRMKEFCLSQPAWSPDGRRMAAISEEGTEGLSEVQLIDAGTGEMSQLTDSRHSPHNNAPSWSPDGNRIGFTSDEFVELGIGYVNLRDGTVVFLDKGDELRWAPNGRSVAYEIFGPYLSEFNAQSKRGLGILVQDLETGDKTLIFDLPAPYSARGGMDWAKKDDHIAISIQPLDETGTQEYNRDIYVMNCDGSQLRGVITSEADEISPTWSPDGTKIAYTSGPGLFTRHLWVSNADGSCSVRLMDVEGVRDPVWSPDGTKIAFAHSCDLYLLDLTAEPIAERLKELSRRE
jgi:Tol biopolymer transport system component